jgi:hypothetical protein
LEVEHMMETEEVYQELAKRVDQLEVVQELVQ